MMYSAPEFRLLAPALEIAGCSPCLGRELTGCPQPPVPGTPCIRTTLGSIFCQRSQG